MNLKSIASGRSDLFQLSPALINVDPEYNVRRFDPVHDEEDASLIESIRQNGIRTPLTVRLVGEQVVVVAGHRRLAAVNLLNQSGTCDEIKTLPCMPEPRGTSDADRVVDLITSNSGKPLTQLEKAKVFVRLLNFGWTEEQVAKKAACSTQHVRDMLALNAVPEPIKARIEAQEIGATLATKIVRDEGEAAATVIDQAIEVAKAEGKTKATPKDIEKVEGSKAAKTAAKKAPQEPIEEVAQPGELVSAPTTPSAPPVAVSAKDEALAALDLMVKGLERLEVDVRLDKRGRIGLERARLAVAEAFDIIDSI